MADDQTEKAREDDELSLVLAEDAGDASCEESVEFRNSIKTQISATAYAFQSKIARQRHDLEKENAAARETAKVRHGLLLRAMGGIRRSLRDVTRIDLGDRYHLFFIGDDFHGWPRLSTGLFDQGLGANCETPLLRVVAHDRRGVATIEIVSGVAGNGKESFSFTQEADLVKLSAFLRKHVRVFLDAVSNVLIENERPSTEPSTHGIEKQLENALSVSPAQFTEALGVDVFSEDRVQHNDLELLPSLDEVEELKVEFGSGTSPSPRRTNP